MLLDENSAQLLLQTNEIETLRKQLVEAQAECSKIQDLESKNNEFITQGKIHDQTISTLQNDLIAKNVHLKKIEKDLEKLGIDWPSNSDDVAQIDLSVENVIGKLVRNSENWKILRDLCARDSETNGSASCLLCQKNIDMSTDTENDLVHHTEKVVSSVAAEWKEQCDQLANDISEFQSANEVRILKNY